MMRGLKIFVHCFVLSASVYSQQYYSSTPLTVLILDNNAPFSSKDASGNWVGFIPDYVKAVAAQAGLTYNLAVQADGVYGMPQADGSWNGLIGALASKKADIVAADLVITPQRLTVVEFPTPYIAVGLRILLPASATSATGLNYVVLKDGSDQEFLQTSPDPKVQAILANIQATNGWLTSYQDGVNRVLAGGVAMVGNEVQLRPYIDANPGKLKFADGEALAQSYYALAVQIGSPLRDQLSIAVSKVNEDGTTSALLRANKIGYIQRT
ncbi:glutamate receptor ionotropic, NMDA 3A-like [Paramacrobiotus metropolitanus]|uniref:glutamate receptor ionotropic, NMDA 3A-like n=1 Tax=Paramacrobiotus metropolitanus TaxID=2943436 RepID=UPI002445FF01|nr:glutamate receptor ionotropic, NMDA 3A-like [Paramacrobiotus metropolitanus]